MTSEATKTTEKVETKAKEQPKKLYGRGKARVQKGLVYAAAVITFAVLLFLIAYILINGIPNPVSYTHLIKCLQKIKGNLCKN